MTILQFVHYTRRAAQASYVDSLENKYHQQCMDDMAETLQKMQADQDRMNPGRGGGVAIAANQLLYPYKPTSATDLTPKPGFYPLNYIPPNIYLIHIRAERALASECDPCPPTFFINPILIPLDKTEPMTYSGEACPSLDGFHGYHVPRYNRIQVYAQNTRGEWQCHEFSGFTSRVHQHEMDFSKNTEYLFRLSFSDAEMQQLKNWLANPILEKNHWVVSDKLQCASSHPDITALKEWVQAHSHQHRYMHHPRRTNRVTVIGTDGDLGFACMRYYLRKGYQVTATYTSNQRSDVLEFYQKKYPKQLTVEYLDLTNQKQIKDFAASMRINSGDMILYDEDIDCSYQPDAIDNTTDMIRYIGLVELTSICLEKMFENNVLWVNLGHFMGCNPSFSKVCAHFQNMDTSFELAWEDKENPEQRPRAFTVYPEKSDASYCPGSDHLAREIMNRIVSMSPGFHKNHAISSKKLLPGGATKYKTDRMGRYSVFVTGSPSTTVIDESTSYRYGYGGNDAN